MDSVKYRLKYIAKLFLIPVLLSIFLIIWFYITDFFGHNFIINNSGFFEYGSTLSDIENGFYRTLSHNTEFHLYNNIASFLILSMIILFIQKTKYFIIQLAAYISFSSIILITYPNGVGFSFVTNALHSTAFVLCLYSLQYNKNQIKLFYYLTLFYLIVLVNMFRQLILDISIIMGFSNIYGFDIVNLIWGDLSNNYTVVSSEVHLLGFLTGIIIFIFIIILNKIMTNSLFRKYNKK